MGLHCRSRRIIFVHGAFGWGPRELPISYWGEALEQYDARFEKHEVKCGPVSSFHDRACELFAQIYGGDFIYDPARARTDDNGGPKRARVPKSERPSAQDRLAPDWSEENPVILVGHSAGAHTCLKLQQLLAEDYWGVGSKADWVEAVICLAGVLNGSTLTYHFGCDRVSGLLVGDAERLIEGIIKVERLLAKLAPGGGGIHAWLEQWNDRDAFVRGSDNLAYDLTLVGCRAANERLTTHPNSYYLSVVTGMPQVELGAPQSNIPFPSSCGDFMNPLLLDAAHYQWNVNFSADAPPLLNWGSTDELKIEAWRENDGAVSSISQRYPFTGGKETPGVEGFTGLASIEKGAWRFQRVETIVERSFDHFDPVCGYIFKPNVLAAHRLLHQKLSALLV